MTNFNKIRFFPELADRAIDYAVRIPPNCGRLQILAEAKLIYDFLVGDSEHFQDKPEEIAKPTPEPVLGQGHPIGRLIETIERSDGKEFWNLGKDAIGEKAMFSLRFDENSGNINIFLRLNVIGMAYTINDEYDDHGWELSLEEWLRDAIENNCHLKGDYIKDVELQYKLLFADDYGLPLEGDPAKILKLFPDLMPPLCKGYRTIL